MRKKNKCILLDIEMPLDRICPASKNFGDRFVCYRDCGFSPIRKEKAKTKRFVQINLTTGENYDDKTNSSRRGIRHKSRRQK